MTSSRRFSESITLMRFGSVPGSMSFPAIISNSVSTCNLSRSSWQALKEDVVVIDIELAIRFRNEAIVDSNVSRSLFCRPKRARPMPTLKFSVVNSACIEVYLSKAVHFPVAHEASAANGKSLDSASFLDSTFFLISATSSVSGSLLPLVLSEPNCDPVSVVHMPST